MSNHPFLNAAAAVVYIAAVASVLFYGSEVAGPMDGIIAPIVFLSLFVFSAAMMGYFFLLKPLQLLFEGKQKEATGFFLATVASFAGIVGVIVLLWSAVQALN